MKSTGTPRKRRWVPLLGTLAVLTALGVYAIHQGPVRLEGKDPAAMGRLEATMWRSYYEGNWLRLGGQTLCFAHVQCGFSPLNSTRLAWHASRAAYHFRTNMNDPRCLRELRHYYARVQRISGRSFDTAQAAELELRWWTQRRQHIPPSGYAPTIARLAAVVLQTPEERLLPASLIRAEAMAYRDAQRHGRMTEQDWDEVARRLESAYRHMHAAVEAAPRE